MNNLLLFVASCGFYYYSRRRLQTTNDKTAWKHFSVDSTLRRSSYGSAADHRPEILEVGCMKVEFE
jgi:hypothetical protein